MIHNDDIQKLRDQLQFVLPYIPRMLTPDELETALARVVPPEVQDQYTIDIANGNVTVQIDGESDVITIAKTMTLGMLLDAIAPPIARLTRVTQEAKRNAKTNASA